MIHAVLSHRSDVFCSYRKFRLTWRADPDGLPARRLIQRFTWLGFRLWILSSGKHPLVRIPEVSKTRRTCEIEDPRMQTSRQHDGSSITALICHPPLALMCESKTCCAY
ncbi:hypothetical protein CRENBAI_025061 [Crenichthys baileyi]|uniref:Uncharacterized protein n=1 Tax=Crenichthys baileyi TaxID=28760 RepID=A0AAV9QTB1_9TELE